MTRNEFEDRIKAEIRRCMAVASERWPEHDFPFPTIKWNDRKTATTAGTAYGPTWTLKFATQMLMDNPDEIENTAAHEYAHLVDYRNNGNNFRYVTKGHRLVRDSHGEHFKNIMHLFGRSDARCHSMKPIKRKQTKRYRYSCGCAKGCDVGPKHNKRIENGTGRIVCRRCRTNLTPRLFQTVLVGNRTDGFKPVGHKTRVSITRKPGENKVTKTVTRTPKRPRPGTKASRALDIVSRYSGFDRRVVIAKLAIELNMSRAGAQTYYYNAKKLIG